MALKPCPHCEKPYHTGAVFASHERKCARDHGVDPQSKPNAYTDKRGKHGGSGSNGSTPPSPERKTVGVGDWVMWDRGTYRGWAFAAVSKKTPSIVELRTGHLGRITWEASALDDDVRAGRVFVINPEDICRLIAIQTERLMRAEFEGGSTMLEAAIENLNLAYYHLSQYRELYE